MKWHRVGCVRGVRLAGFWIDHQLRVAMIGGDQSPAPGAAHRLSNPTETSVDVLTSFNCLIQLARVTDHVGVCKVYNEDVGFASFDRAQQFVGDFEGGHLWSQIVSRHLRRRHQQALLVRELAFRAAVEKVSDVRVLLSLGHAIVFNFADREDVGQDISRLRWWKRYGQRIALVVNRKADKVCVRPVGLRKITEARDGQRAGDLPRPIRAKVEKDYRVTVFDLPDRLAVIAHADNWLDELISHVALVRLSDRG